MRCSVDRVSKSQYNADGTYCCAFLLNCDVEILAILASSKFWECQNTYDWVPNNDFDMLLGL